jgi:DNA topoisomerase-3
MLETIIFRGYAERDAKCIFRSTAKGRELVDIGQRLGLPLTDPLLTAQWEDKIADIASGKLPFEVFMQEQIAALGPMIEATKRGDIPLENDTGKACPKCKSPLIKRTFKQSGKPFYACTNPDCNAAFFQNDDGTPGSQLGEKGSGSSGGSPAEGAGPELPCCKAKAVEQTTKNKAKYLRCPICRAAYWVDKTTGGVGKKWDK